MSDELNPMSCTVPRRTALATALVVGAAATLAPTWARAQGHRKVLVVPRHAQFKSMDPARGFEEDSMTLIQMGYSALLKYAWLERPYRTEPDLLDRMPQPSADRLTWTFTLRQGVVFHDDACFPGGKGRELTSDDVLYSLKHFANVQRNTASWFLLEGMVVGLNEFREATKALAPKADTTGLPISGFTRLDRHRFSIRLVHDTGQFLHALASPALSIIASEAVRHYGDSFDIHPVGTGPFILKDFERKGTLRWVRNPRYHGRYPTVGEAADGAAGLLQAGGQGLPFVDAVDMPLIEEVQPRMLRFLRGELDLEGLDRANFDKMARRDGERFVLAPEFAGKFKLYQTEGLNIINCWINMKDPLLGGNKLLRQALARLFDVQADINTLLGGRARRIASVVPHALAGNDQQTGARPVDYDPAAARELLAKAGYPEGRGLPELTLSWGFSGVDWRDRFDFHRSRFAAAGVRLKPQYTDLPTFTKALEGGNFQLALYGWLADYADAENFYQLLYSKNAAPGSNSSSFKHSGYDKAYEASRFLTDGPERLKHFRAMNTIIQQEVPLIPLFNRIALGVQQNRLRNHKRNVMTRGYEYLDIDPSAPAKAST